MKKLNHKSIGKFSLGILMAMLLFLAGCSTGRVITDMDSEANFAQYKTYGLKVLPNPEADKYPTDINQLNKKRIENAIHEEMKKRGYIFSENPDIWVTYRVDIGEKKSYSGTTNHMGGPYGGWYGYGGYGWGGYGFNSSYTHMNEYTYKEGTLMVSMIDADEDKLLWYAANTNTLKDNNKKIDRDIKSSIEKVFSRYPYLAGQAEMIKHRPI
ncbi:DUF4136 domain-containing protein [Flammeovirgaceae bacterium SG7u.111]|nr:DUF4136 domain-containing protein [Flammeovirgaceae bacterium SG7u.132]WPO35605.1 DUF4136 domain-containing protein [Flammeovirgaceae bacterium SG7u.111]